MRKQVIVIRIPKPVYKIIKSANTRSITDFKFAEDGIKRIDFQLSSPLSQRSNLKIQRQQIGTVHAGRSSWLGAKYRISIFELFIDVGKVKIPETVNDVPCRMGNGIRVRIIFTKISNNKVLVVGMTATVNR